MTSDEKHFRSMGAPRLWRDAAEREPRLADNALLNPQSGGG